VGLRCPANRLHDLLEGSLPSIENRAI